MLRPRFISGLRRLWLSRFRRRNNGFTLTELLVAMLIGTIITGALLSLVIDLTEVNQKDVARSETQRDAQLAMNFIVEDLREAIFVYDGDCLQGSGGVADIVTGTFCPGIVNHIAPVMTSVTASARYTPVLAFWRADPLSDELAQICRTQSNNSLTAFTNYLSTSQIPCVAGRSYTLVVYGIVTDLNPNDTTWRGRARLVRYQLPQFTGSPPTITPGWVDPLANDGTFRSWPYQKPVGASTYTNQQTTLPGNGPSVLIDFMDDTNASTLPANSQPTCTTPSRLTPNNAVPSNPGNVRSFYACVRGNTLNAQADPTLAAEVNVNQEVLVVLTANPAGRAGIPLNSPSNSDRLSPLQARVLTRGVVQKSPASSF